MNPDPRIEIPLAFMMLVWVGVAYVLLSRGVVESWRNVVISGAIAIPAGLALIFLLLRGIL